MVITVISSENIKDGPYKSGQILTTNKDTIIDGGIPMQKGTKVFVADPREIHSGTIGVQMVDTPSIFVIRVPIDMLEEING